VSSFDFALPWTGTVSCLYLKPPVPFFDDDAVPFLVFLKHGLYHKGRKKSPSCGNVTKSLPLPHGNIASQPYILLAKLFIADWNNVAYN
jgi:hypothetical protein